MKTTSRIPLRRSLAALVVAALLAVVLAPSSSTQVQAQTEAVTLVGNVNEQEFGGNYYFAGTFDPNPRHHGNIVRQHFTTGPNAAGYRLSSITFPWLRASAPVEISLWRTDHDRQLPPTASYLGTLGSAASFLGNFNPWWRAINSTIEAGKVTYALPSPVTLAANTEYQILIEPHDNSGVTVPMTATIAEDADSAPGWSIADTSFRFGLVAVQKFGILRNKFGVPIDKNGAPTTSRWIVPRGVGG